jgi:hypothetical protein
MLTAKLFDILTADYVFDQNELEKIYKEHTEFHRSNDIVIRLQFIVVATPLEAATALAEIRAGAEFLAVSEKYSEMFGEIFPGREEPFPDDVLLFSELKSFYMIKTGDIGTIINLKPGEVSNIFETTDGIFYILNIVDVEEPEYGELRQQLFDYFTGQGKRELYRSGVEAHADTLDVTVNHFAVGTVKVRGL